MRAFRTIVLTTAILVTFNSQSNSASYTGSALLELCSGVEGDGVNMGICFGYISAIVDLSKCGQNVFGYSSKMPSGATVGQITKVVVKYLNDHPQQLHYTAVSMIAAALHEAFPCP